MSKVNLGEHNWEDLYLVGKKISSYRRQWPRKIIGVKMVKPPLREPRPCYQVQFEDGEIDYVPLSEIPNEYDFVTFSDIVIGNIPQSNE